MNYDQAKAIITEVAPDLIVDPDNGHAHICVRKSEAGAPFSIMLTSLDPASYRPIAAQDATPEVPAIEASDDHPGGQPLIPARPAVVARTVEGQVAEAEKTMLLNAIDAANKMLA